MERRRCSNDGRCLAHSKGAQCNSDRFAKDSQAQNAVLNYVLRITYYVLRSLPIGSQMLDEILQDGIRARGLVGQAQIEHSRCYLNCDDIRPGGGGVPV